MFYFNQWFIGNHFKTYLYLKKKARCHIRNATLLNFSARWDVPGPLLRWWSNKPSKHLNSKPGILTHFLETTSTPPPHTHTQTQTVAKFTTEKGGKGSHSPEDVEEKSFEKMGRLAWRLQPRGSCLRQQGQLVGVRRTPMSLSPSRKVSRVSVYTRTMKCQLRDDSMCNST